MKKVKEVFRELRKNKWNYLFLTPAALYTFIFGYATLPYMIIAFEKFDFGSLILISEDQRKPELYRQHFLRI